MIQAKFCPANAFSWRLCIQTPHELNVVNKKKETLLHILVSYKGLGGRRRGHNKTMAFSPSARCAIGCHKLVSENESLEFTYISMKLSSVSE